MPDESIPGRALVTRHAVIDIVRRVTLGSYGVAGFDGGPVDAIVGALERRPGGLRVAVDGGSLEIHLRLRVAHGLPIAEVARQVDSAIRYAIRRALDREVDRLTIRIAGFESRPGAAPPGPPSEPAIGSSDLAGSGTDVA
ncbi:MAG: Asp23/Gls24 family envelope stress response protein [Candidatus Limnocylindrales bacterium]